LYREAHGAGIFKDEHESAPERRYKMFFRHDTKAGNVVSVAFSADGVHWSEARATNAAGVRADTHNNAMWAPTLQRYVAFTRDWGPGREDPSQRVRLVARTESEDFRSWTRPEVVLQGLADNLQTYSLPAIFLDGVYLGFPALFNIAADRVQTE